MVDFPYQCYMNGIRICSLRVFVEYRILPLEDLDQQIIAELLHMMTIRVINVTEKNRRISETQYIEVSDPPSPQIL